MQITKNNALWLGLSLFLIVILALIFWLKPNDSTLNEALASGNNSTVQGNGQSQTSSASGDTDLAFSSKSQQDTQIDCEVRVDSSNSLIVNDQTRNCFEYFITQYGEKTLDQVKSSFLSYIKNTYKEPVLSQLTDLWSRYIDYRSKLGDIQPPNLSKDDVNYYRAVFAGMQNLRKQFFSNYEIEGLFGNENTYNEYTLSRLEIMNNKTLSAAEKADKLKQLFNALPDDLKESLQQLSQLEDLRKLTSDIKKRGGSAEELHEMRTNLVGPEATQRLENLDVQRNDWKQRVTAYLSSRDSVVKSSMSDKAKADAIQQLRAQQFSSPQEQLRVETFENEYDQGGKLSFAE